MADRLRSQRQAKKQRRDTDTVASLQPDRPAVLSLVRPQNTTARADGQAPAAISAPVPAGGVQGKDLPQFGYDFANLQTQPQERVVVVNGSRIVQRKGRGKAAKNPAKQSNQHPVGIDAAIPLAFPDYRIQTPAGRIPELGHAGVLIIDGKTGTTKYFEYGRYDPANLGLVRQRTIPNVQFGPDGRPTAASIARALRSISTQSGHGGRIAASYIPVDGHYPAMMAYAMRRKAQNSDPHREEYGLWGNNCMHFAKQVAEAGGAATPIMIDPRPNSYIEELRDQYPDLNYAPDTRAATFAQ